MKIDTAKLDSPDAAYLRSQKKRQKISLFYDFLVGMLEIFSFKVYDRCFTAFNSNELRFFSLTLHIQDE